MVILAIRAMKERYLLFLQTTARQLLQELSRLQPILPGEIPLRQTVPIPAPIHPGKKPRCRREEARRPDRQPGPQAAQQNPGHLPRQNHPQVHHLIRMKTEAANREGNHK